MAPPVGSLVVRIGSDIRGLISGFAKGGKTVKGFGEVTGRVAKRIAKLTAVTTAAATALGVVLTRQGLKSIDAQAKFARVIGISTEKLAGLQLAAKETADFTDQQFNLAIQRMTRRIAEAAQGSGEAQGAIRSLGLDAKELAAAGPDEAFLRISDAMQDVTDSGERLRLGFKLFDSEGARLVNTLALGRRELEGYVMQADALGLAFSNFDARQVEAANDAIGRIGLVVEGISRNLAIELSPVLLEIAERITKAATASGGFGSAISSAVSGAIRFVGSLINKFRDFQINLLALDIVAAKVEKRRLQFFGSPEEFQKAMRNVEEATERLGEFQNKPPFDADEFIASVQAKAEAAARAADIVTSGGEVGTPLGRLEGDTGGEDPELVAAKEKIAAKLEVLRTGLISERELENEAFADKLALLQQARQLEDDELLSTQEFQTQKELLEKQHQARLTDIETREAEARARAEAEMQRNRIAAVAGFLAQMTSQLASAAEDNFKLQKALSIASAVLSGIESVIHSYNFGAKIGGPILGAAFAAIAAGVQFARIAQISSQSFQRGSSGASAPSTPPGGTPAPTGGGGGGGGGGAQAVNISLVGETFGRTQVRDLIESINEAVDDGARLRVV